MNFVINIGNVRRELKILSIGSGRYPYLPVVGDRELIIEAVRLLIPFIPTQAEILFAPEFGGAIIAHHLSINTGLPYIIARKKVSLDFGSGISIPVKSVASKQASHLHVAEHDVQLLQNRSVLLVDEVVCQGGTMNALQMIADSAGARLAGKMAIASQGDRRPDIITLLHLPQIDK